VIVFCSELEMNNPYRQFTVQPRLNARFQANTPSSSLNNYNFHSPAIATVRLLSPTVAYANSHMYNALYSNTPAMTVARTPDLVGQGGQAAFTPMCMMNSHPGMTVMPVIPIDLQNQHSRVCHPANYPEAAELLGQYFTKNATVSQNQTPALHTLPQVSVAQSTVGNPANVHIPFRELQWIPPAVHETGVPQIPYAVEIKPQIDETPQNHDPFGTAVPVSDAECGSEWSVPTVYLDIAMDSCLDANTRSVDVPSAVGDVSMVNATLSTGSRKRVQCESSSGIKALKLVDDQTIKPDVVCSVRRDSTTVTTRRSKCVEECYVVDDEEVNEPVVDASPVPVQEQELSSSQDATLSPSALSVASEPGELIRSDEDVGDGDVPHDDSAYSLNEGVDSDKVECYEVMPTNSDALLFDMECDGEKDDETLRVILPTKNVKTTCAPKNIKTTCASTASSAPLLTSLLKTAQSKQKRKVSTTSHSSAVQIVLDADDSDVVIVEPRPRRRKPPVTRSQRLATRTENRLQTVTIKKNENSLLGVPLQSSFFRFETQSTEVYRLLSMDKSLVPRNVLTLLANLVSSAIAPDDDKQCSHSDLTDSTFGGIPCGRSRKLLFQCLLCPYGELSAKRVMGHVKQQHKQHVSFMQRCLLPNCQTLLHIYCRHCNFITYDNAALLIHFAIYHKVDGILLSVPKVIESDPAWEPTINPSARAKDFPFFCCPDCGYVDVERNRVAKHILEKPSSETVFFGGCVVRLIMVVRGSKPSGAFTYESLRNDESHAMFRKEIYACVSCRFFSFYPTYAFSHYVVRHSCLEVLYVCAASPSCSRRYTTRDDIISHIQGVHVAMKSMRFQCTATLLDISTLTQLDISPGQLMCADVPVNISYRCPSSASDSTSLEAAIEIVDDDDVDDDGDDDVVVLDSPCDHDTSADVEPDSPFSEERSDCSIVCTNTESSSASAMAEPGVTEQNWSEFCLSSTEDRQTDTVAEHCGEANVEPYVVHGIENGTAKASDATCDTVDSVCCDDDRSATEVDCGQNNTADVSSHVEDESLKLVECDLLSGKTDEEIDKAESQSVENTMSTNTLETSHVESVESHFGSSFPSRDTNLQADSTAVVTEMVNNIGVPSNEETSTRLQSVENLVPGTSHKASLDLVECSTSSSKNTNHLVHVSGSVNHAGKSYTESDSAATPCLGTSPDESVDSAKHLAFLNDSTNRLPECATVNHSVNDAANTPVSLEIYQSDDVQEGEHDTSVNEGGVRSPQLNSATTAEEELLGFDPPNNADLFDCSVDDDALPSFECKSPSDPLESSERYAMDLQRELLVLSEQLTAGETPHCSNVERASCSVVSEAESVVDDSCIVSKENPCLGPFRESSDDNLCGTAVENEQLHTSSSSWSLEADVIDKSLQEDLTETSLPSYADCNCEIPSESRHSEVNAQTDSANEQSNSSDTAVQPVSRFKSLAGFRFPVPHTFTAKPS